MKSRESLLAEIAAAFPLRPVPEVGLYQTHFADALYMGRISEVESRKAPALDGRRSWTEYRNDELRTLDAAMAHQSIEGFIYFLPAYLSSAIRHASRDDDEWSMFVGHVVFQCTNASDYKLARFDRLTRQQTNVVVDFLEFIVLESDDHDSTLARKSLERFWRKRASA